LTAAGLVDLDQATGQVATAAGTALRREGRTRKNLLQWDREATKQTRGRPASPITNSRNPFHRACTALLHGEHAGQGQHGNHAEPGAHGERPVTPTTGATTPADAPGGVTVNGTAPQGVGPGPVEPLVEQGRRERRALQATLAAVPPGLPTRLPRAQTRTL
jgi:hypothetical protein